MSNLFNRLRLGFFLWGLATTASLKGSGRSFQKLTADTDLEYMKDWHGVDVKCTRGGPKKVSIDYNPTTKQVNFTLAFKNISNRLLVFIPLRIDLSLKEKIPQGFAKTKDYWFAIKPQETITKSFTMQISSDNEKFLNQELNLYFNHYGTSKSYLRFFCFKAYQHWRSLCVGFIVLLVSYLLFRYRATIMAWGKHRLKGTKKKK